MSSHPGRGIERIRRVARGLRAGWLMVGITVALLLGMEVAARMAYMARDRVAGSSRPTSSWTEFRRATSVLRKSPWSAQYAREWDESYETEWRPYVYWRRKPYRGQYVNIDERGIRRTVNPVSWEEADVRVLALGGSTMWGTGARDEGTIASHLSRELNGLDLGSVYVENLGESGYTSTQELIQLYLLLRDGCQPDVVVFYDGFNDLHAAHQNGESGIPMNESNRRAEFNLGERTNQSSYRRRLFIEDLTGHSALARALASIRGRFTRREPPRPTSAAPVDEEALARDVVRHYLTNVEEVRSLAERYGFRSHFFWQPMLATKGRLSDEEEKAVANWGAVNIEFERRVNELLAAAEHPAVVDLQDLFDDEALTVFLDYTHVGEHSNARIAKEIAAEIAAAPAPVFPVPKAALSGGGD